MSEAILFQRCLGLNDSKAIATQTMITSPRAKNPGSVELIDCLNLTTTPDGCVQKLAPFVPALETGAAITSLSAGSRLMFGDGANVREWTGGENVVNRFPGITGPVAHTLLDVRVAAGGKVYKSVNPAVAMTEALVGTYTGPVVTRPFSAMPEFRQAFVYNSRLYAVNAADPRFLQYSEDYAYDLYALGDNHIGSTLPVLQAGQIPGVVVTGHEGGVTAYLGSGQHDFVKRFYPCSFIAGTLYSGRVTQTTGASDGSPATAVVHQHVFLCHDGLYAIGQDGALVNATNDQLSYIDALNASYSCATVQDGKYLAFGDRCCLEYDFSTKALLKRATFGVTGACVWNDVNYFASGSMIVTAGSASDTTGDFGCSLTLPYSDLGASGRKSIEALYFTGTMNGDLLITATDQNGEQWEHELNAELNRVTNCRIKTPRRFLGNHISFKLECPSGAFRLEGLRAVFAASKRSN